MVRACRPYSPMSFMPRHCSAFKLASVVTRNTLLSLWRSICARTSASTCCGMSGASFGPGDSLRPGRSSRSMDGTAGECTCSSIILVAHT